MPSHAVAVSLDGSGFAAEAAGDLDGNGQVQYWGYAMPRADGGAVPTAIGCTVANLTFLQRGPCNAGAGQRVF